MKWLLSLFGPAYFAHAGDAYLWAVPLWAVCCAIGFIWQNREAMKAAKQTAYGPDETDQTKIRLGDAFLWFSIAAAFLALHSVVFWAVRALA